MVCAGVAIGMAASGLLLQAQEAGYSDFTVNKPFTRWWWFASEIDTIDIKYQIDWLKANEFGGVEIAWVYPMNGDTTIRRYGWLSPEWTNAVVFAKKYANRQGLACDFTYGTLWPFGDSRVPPEEGTMFFGDSVSPKTMRLTWEHPEKGRVINHLDHQALESYSQRLISELRPALPGSTSALFCDSWEVETKRLWTKGFGEEFMRRFGYDVAPLLDSLFLPGFERIYYDYMTLLSDYVLYEFYGPFTEIAHRYGAISRVQCGGAPTDLLTAFSMVDIPEAEAILFEPTFARIPASAALITEKPVVSAEAFTCLYGWKGWPGPGPHQGEERIPDMKLVADALFANGVNEIIWHGMPFNREGGTNRFYASVHVGPDAGFAAELPGFNRYLQKVTGYMRTGTPYTGMGVYLPVEDARMGVEYPDSLQFPWAWGEYELRYVKFPEEVRGYQPVWINRDFLLNIRVVGNRFFCGKTEIPALYVDVQYLDTESLEWLYTLAQRGFPVCLKRDPGEPGTASTPGYFTLVSALKALPNVGENLHTVYPFLPLISGDDIPEFQSRYTPDGLLIFFANPLSKEIRYPLRYEQSYQAEAIEKEVTINFKRLAIPLRLRFEPNQSLLVTVSKDGLVEFADIGYQGH
jgi:hypothetical protein